MQVSVFFFKFLATLGFQSIFIQKAAFAFQLCSKIICSIDSCAGSGVFLKSYASGSILLNSYVSSSAFLHYLASYSVFYLSNKMMLSIDSITITSSVFRSISASHA